jgi:NhaA family Na+:H+ antiporter
MESAGGLVLLACGIAAILWANSPAADFYSKLLHIPIAVGFGQAQMSKDLHYWINDGLMAIFFLFAGMEIKHEVLAGELSSFKLAALPVFAAVGGVIFPAAIYIALNHGHPTADGWGIPMATDIAFALGILSLSGSRVPVALKVFLTALAIVDDLIAVLVIAFFYSDQIHWNMLLASFGFVALCAIANWLGVRYVSVYLILGAGIWYFMTQSGVHATIAGVLLALVIPDRRVLDTPRFLRRARHDIESLERSAAASSPHRTQAPPHELEMESQLMESPLIRLERFLAPWVNFFILPLFALTNAGVELAGIGPGDLSDRAFHGIFFGLLFGKPIGIMLFSWLVVRLGVARLPQRVTWKQMHAVGWLGGIGFTMSLFIAALAFGDGHEDLMAKIGILSASAVAAIIGSLLLRLCPRPPVETES